MSYVRTVTARTVSCPESHVFSPVGTVATTGVLRGRGKHQKVDLPRIDITII
jgi:hypothetical protein